MELFAFFGGFALSVGIMYLIHIVKEERTKQTEIGQIIDDLIEKVRKK